MSHKKFEMAQELIESAMGIIDSIKVKGSVSEKSKEDAKAALYQALGSLKWMKQMNGNQIVKYLDEWHDSEDHKVVNF